MAEHRARREQQPPSDPDAAALNTPLEDEGGEESAASGDESTARTEKYNAAGWKERARRRFGVSPHAMVGALHDFDSDKALTEAQVRKALGVFEEVTGVDSAS